MARDSENKAMSLSVCDIIRIQQQLGVFPSGKSDETLRNAISAFQKAHGLPETGKPDSATCREIEKLPACAEMVLQPTLSAAQMKAALECNRKRMANRDTESLHTFLNVRADDICDETTRRIVAYQLASGQTPDGCLHDDLLSLCGIPLLPGTEKSKPSNQKVSDLHITSHFIWKEFESRGDHIQVPEEFKNNIRILCQQLETLRKALGGRPIHILSGWRSAWWNKRTGHTGNSPHIYGKAADFTVDGMTPSAVRRVLEQLIDRGSIHNGGVGRYPDFTHYDIADVVRRWNG